MATKHLPLQAHRVHDTRHAPFSVCRRSAPRAGRCPYTAHTGLARVPDTNGFVPLHGIQKATSGAWHFPPPREPPPGFFGLAAVFTNAADPGGRGVKGVCVRVCVACGDGHRDPQQPRGWGRSSRHGQYIATDTRTEKRLAESWRVLSVRLVPFHGEAFL